MALSSISEKKSHQVVYTSTFQYQTRISSNLPLILPTPILFFFLVAMEGMAVPPGTHSPLRGKGRTSIRKAEVTEQILTVRDQLLPRLWFGFLGWLLTEFVNQSSILIYGLAIVHLDISLPAPNSFQL